METLQKIQNIAEDDVRCVFKSHRLQLTIPVKVQIFLEILSQMKLLSRVTKLLVEFC